jgi:hypothetical protein
MELDEITKENFEAYEVVRESGVTNMFDRKTVMSLSGLDKETVTAIMMNYGALMDKFPDVRK